MAKYTVLVTDETVFHKVIDIPDGKDPQEYVDQDFMDNQESYSILDSTYSTQLIPQENTDAKTQPD